MEHAYTRGMKVHRDIKPQNCLMSRDGTLKISDFGLVRIYEQDAPGAGGGLTRVGSVLGTPMYLAPEQFLNSSGVDARADIYSAGVMFYEMLCGRTPFVADPRDAKKWFQLHLYTPAPPLGGELTAKSPLRPQLEAVIHRCLTKTPEQRYATFAELRLDFERLYRALTGTDLPEPKVAELASAADLCNKAFSLGELGRTQEEAVILEQVLNTDPQDPDDWIQRGAILARLGDAQSAQVCFAQASLVHRVAPGRKVVGKPRKAMTLPTKFFGSDADQAGALHSIARLFVELNRAPEALPYLEQVLTTDPRNIDVLLTQAEALSRLGRFKESLLSLQKAIKLDNGRADAWLKAGMTLIALKQTDGARDALEKSLRLAESSEGWFQLGGIYLAAEKYTHAIKCYDQAQALDPKNPAVWSHKGLTMAKSGRFDDALMCFTEADRLGDPKAAEAIARMQALLADQELDAKVVQE